MYSIRLLIILLLASCTAFAQTSLKSVHIDSLSRKEFLGIKERPLTLTRYKDSTVLLLKILTKDGRFVEGLSTSGLGHQVLLKSSTNVDSTCSDLKLIEVKENDKRPLNIAVVLDYSGSMSWAYKEMQKQAEAFIKSIPGAKFTRINFDDVIDPVDSKLVPRPSSPLYDRYYKYGGATALNSAIREGIKSLSAVKENKFVVVFTDGMENASGIGPNAVINYAQSNNTPVYGISFGVNPDMQRLREICRFTKGNFYPVYELDSLSNEFEKISLGDLGRYYKVSSTCADSLKFDQLSIKVLNSGDSITLSLKNAYKEAPVFEDPVVFNTFKFAASGQQPKDKSFSKRLKNTADNLMVYLKANPTHEIYIVGHASPDGEEDQNWSLSRKRAENVRNAIVEYLDKEYPKDIKVLNRIQVRFKGHTEPIFDVKSKYNLENRRVNIEVYVP
ncbi:MAG: OmpA family protein [Bacteroidia bacterium]|nr:OmpA family protein [Bacteroidia bacterium]